MRENIAMVRVGLKPMKDVPTLAATLEDWTRAMAGVADPRHIANVRGAILLHLRPLLALPLDQLDNRVVEDVRTAYLNCKGTGHRPGQEGEWDLDHTLGGANKVVQHLGSVVGWAVRRGLINKRPYDLTPLKVQEDPRAILWPEQVGSFLNEADRGRKLLVHPFPHAATAIRLMIGLGLREDEALGARWEWLDRRRQVYVVGRSKSRNIRGIPVPGWLLDHLDRVLGPTTAVPHGLILPMKGEQPHSGQFTAKPVARCAANLGIQRLTPHSLRQSFATAHFEANTSISQIRPWLWTSRRSFDPAGRDQFPGPDSGRPSGFKLEVFSIHSIRMRAGCSTALFGCPWPAV